MFTTDQRCSIYILLESLTEKNPKVYLLPSVIVPKATIAVVLILNHTQIFYILNLYLQSEYRLTRLTPMKRLSLRYNEV